MPTEPKAKEQFLVDGKGRRVGVLLGVCEIHDRALQIVLIVAGHRRDMHS